MKKALVAGASGGIGYALVLELISRGVEVVAFSRGKTKLDSLYKEHDQVTIFPGDVLNESDMLMAAEGVDVIFHAIGFPYQEWEEKHLACIDVMIKTAQKQQAKIALADNIYAYGIQSNGKVTEAAKKNPHTKKGKMRLDMENRLKQSSVPSLIVHLPDLYGPNAENTLLHETLKNTVQHKTANFVGNTKIAREFIYTFDGAKAVVELALREDTYDQNWNIPASRPITGEDLAAMLREETGYNKALRPVSKTMIRLIGLFSPFMKEMVEMMYLTETPVILSGEKYEKEIGPLPQTSYQQGLRETLAWMKNTK